MRSRRTWWTALLAPVVAIVVAMPAGADSGKHCTEDGWSGCATFLSDGDQFYVCDNAPDGHGVVVRYTYVNKAGRNAVGYAWNYLGGGCRIDVEDHSGPMWRMTCLADDTKPGGTPGKKSILWGTCGGLVGDNFGK